MGSGSGAAVATVDAMPPVDRFLALCDAPAAATPLDELGFRLARCFRPGLDVEVQRRRLDDLAELVPTPSLDDVLATVFGVAGFRGNSNDYYDPANSLLDAVLDRRTGIPLSLAVVTIEVARRAGVALVGVGMPGHFLLRSAADDDSFIDPFTGARLDRAGCAAFWQRMFGPATPFRDDWLAPTPNAHIAARMVANLESAFRRRNDMTGVAIALELRAGMPQASFEERGAAAQALAGTGRFDRAAAALERHASDAGTPERRRRELETDALRLRARLN
jgi:regulator of sirC expression with transglutaminase-like and TPR domain